MEFYTEWLHLRPWLESDAETLFEYARDPAVGPIAGWKPHTSPEDSLHVIRTVLSAPETYAVCLDGRSVGSIGLMRPNQTLVPTEASELEIGYWIGVPFWGQGYIPEAVRALLRHAFSDMGCTVMWCGCYDGNERSRRVQEKCGFVYHHTERDKPNAIMGDIRTEHYTQLTKERWLQLNAMADGGL